MVRKNSVRAILSGIRAVLAENPIVSACKLEQSLLGKGSQERIAGMRVDNSTRDVHILLGLAQHVIEDEMQRFKASQLALAS